MDPLVELFGTCREVFAFGIVVEVFDRADALPSNAIEMHAPCVVGHFPAGRYDGDRRSACHHGARLRRGYTGRSRRNDSHAFISW